MAGCNWKPPEGTPGREEYQCRYPLFKSRKKCIFHLPMAENAQAKKSHFKLNFDEFFINGVLKDDKGDFRGFVFPDGIDLSGRDFRRSNERSNQPDIDQDNYNPVNFSDAIFGNGVNFETTKFGRNVSFWGAAFGDDARFFDCRFGPKASFHSTRFGKRANFDLAQFKENATFILASFGDGARFYLSHFYGEAKFKSSDFGDRSIISASHFYGPAYFSEARFGERANLENTHFHDFVDFDLARFGSLASFFNTQFHGPARFEWTTFGANTRFTETNFFGRVDFRNVSGVEEYSRGDLLQARKTEGDDDRVTYNVVFSKQTPAQLIFRGAKFKGHAIFQESDLSRVRFQQVELKQISFLHSQISETKFISCEWGTGPEKSRYAQWESPRRFAFKRPRMLLDELICRDKLLENAERSKNEKNGVEKSNQTQHNNNAIRLFRKKPYIEPPKLQKAKVDTKRLEMDIRPSDIEVLALQLKQSLEATKDPIAAGDFHFAVMEMKRMQAMEAKRWGRAVMLWLYKMVNGYGERYGRTALWLLFLIAGWAFAYFQLNGLDATAALPKDAKIMELVPKLDFWRQVWFSIAYALQHVLPFKLYGNYLCVVGENLHVVQGLAMAQTLVGSTLFTFFALALRRRFKR